MWKLKRTQKYFIEIIHTWVRNEGEGRGGIWSFGRVLEEQTNQKQKTGRRRRHGSVWRDKTEKSNERKKNKPKQTKVGLEWEPKEAPLLLLQFGEKGALNLNEPLVYLHPQKCTTVIDINKHQATHFLFVGREGVIRGSIQNWSINPFTPRVNL